MKTRKQVEGVTYYKYLVRYQFTDKSKHTMTFWSPGAPWVRTAVARTLDHKFGIDRIQPGSVTIKFVG